MVKPIAVTMGEPAGIGPELILMAWRERDPAIPFFAFTDPNLMRDRASACGLDIPLAEIDETAAMSTFNIALPIVPLRHAAHSSPGLANPDTPDAVIESIDRAVKAIRDGRAGAVVTAPIMKDALYRAGFQHAGHTDYLGELAKRYWGQSVTPVMMIWSENLAVVPVTVHIPIASVPMTLTETLIVETADIVAADLRARFGIPHPRLAIAGLNPHAGENGAIGTEEITVITPAIERLKQKGLNVRGPLPADTLFHERARQTYDVAICMYHDQALVPVKALAFDVAVNITLGLPFVRTSPDHGTAFDLAGTGKANPSSFIEALKLAHRLSRS